MQSQWVAKMVSNPSYFQGTSYPDAANRPVEQVSWNTIQDYLSTTGMRLPSEAEWEYACRAGTQTPFYNGSTLDSTVDSLAWYGSCCNGNSGGQTHAVGGKTPNGFGLYDMLGNAWEWVNDQYDTYPEAAQTNPTGPTSLTNRVMRGGSFYYDTLEVRSSDRYSLEPNYSYRDVGFRVVRNP